MAEGWLTPWLVAGALETVLVVGLMCWLERRRFRSRSRSSR